MFLSNSEGRLVLTTGNKSELAVGYCTLYGDMAGGLAVKWLLIAAAAGGAVVAGTIAATGGNGNGGGGATPRPPTTVTPGTPSVGGPQ